MAAGNVPRLQLRVQDVLNCALTAWYEKFSKYTAKTLFIPLSNDFISYLKQDGIVLPEGCEFPQFGRDEVSNDNSDPEWSDDEEEDPERGIDNVPKFYELTHEIEYCIQELGGVVFPKLNWSSPRDAYWVLPGNSLKCNTAAEVYLLLKSSDFIHHDLSRVFEYCADGEGVSAPPSGYKLGLRAWVAVNPGSEFRCFVRDNTLIAITQRDTSTYYKHISKCKEKIKEDISCFYSSVLHRKFQNSSYVFDVYQDKKETYQLIDINPFCEMTDPLLFSWEELRNWKCSLEGECLSEKEGVSTRPEIRVIDSVGTIRPSDLQSSQFPKDAVELTSSEAMTEELAKIFQNSSKEFGPQ